MSKMFKCPRCGNYSIKKMLSPLLHMLLLDIIGFFAIFLLGVFALFIWFILLFLTIIVLIAKILNKKRVVPMYKCTSCGIEISEDKIDFNA